MGWRFIELVSSREFEPAKDHHCCNWVIDQRSLTGLVSFLLISVRDSCSASPSAGTSPADASPSFAGGGSCANAGAATAASARSSEKASPSSPSTRASWLEGEDPLPVFLHADHDPAALPGFVQQGLRERPHPGVG